MANEDNDTGAGAVRTEPNVISTPRLSLDDLRLRLDQPLFARDPGLQAGQAGPHLRELTWDSVVNQAAAAGDEPAAPVGAIRVEELFAEQDRRRQEAAAPAEDGVGIAQADATVAAGPATAAAAVEVAAESTPPADVVRRPSLPSLLSTLNSGPVPHIVAGDPAPSADHVHESSEPDLRPRDPDPVVHGLADLIVRSTPITGMPAVQPPSEVAIAASETAVEEVKEVAPLTPWAEEAVPTPAAAAPAVPAATPPTSVEAQPAAPGPRRERSASQQAAERALASLDSLSGQHPRVEPVNRRAAIEAELDRLAFLPDAEAEDLGPIVVPAISVSDAPATGTSGAVAASPALALSNSEIYAPRSSGTAAAAGHMPRRSYAEFASAPVLVKRRRKRGWFRRAVTLLVLLAMVGGGLFAVKKYVLDARWSGDIKPFADAVEAASGLAFDHAIDVSALEAGDYADRLSAVTLGIDDETRDTTAAEWRALGLLSGEMDTRAVGLAAMPSAPAFYDPAAERVYVLADAPAELRTFALHRALAMALLDQEYGWGTRTATAAPAVRIGTTALYDAAALEVALSLVTDDVRETIYLQILGLYSTHSIPSSPSPYATVVAGRLGVAAWPLFRATTAVTSPYLKDAAPADAQVLDLRRLVSGTPVPTTANARGMLYWYHVLAGRVDDDMAWRAVSLWAGDSVTELEAAGTRCVAAMFQATGGDTTAARAGFEQWAAQAPAGSSTTVTAAEVDGGVQFTINACDPGAAVATTDGSGVLGLGSAPMRSEQMRLLTEQQTGLTENVAACAAAFGEAMSLADERGVIDPVGGWQAAVGRALPDPQATGCTAA